MSLRRESLRAYRALWRAATLTAVQCAGGGRVDDVDGGSFVHGLQRYVSGRVAHASAMHRERLMLALHQLQTQQPRRVARDDGNKDEDDNNSDGSSSSSNKQRRTGKAARRARARRAAVLLRQHEAVVSRQIDDAYALARVLPCAVGDAALTSLLRALAARVGNAAYQRTLEQSFCDLVTFATTRAARDEATAEATSERQNRILQAALRAYGERLLLLHRTAMGEQPQQQQQHDSSRRRARMLPYLTPWQATEAIVGTRSGVAAHHVRHGHEQLIVEVDEPFNKQVVYVCRVRSNNSNSSSIDDADDDEKKCKLDDGDDDGGSYDWTSPIEDVDVCECDEVPRTLFHAEFLHTATRLCDALAHETPLHPSRKTVLVGHGVGGALAVIMALLLSQRGYEVNNVVTFGAPKVLQGTLQRHVAAINPIRVVLEGDPLVDLPVSGAEGGTFVHIGEILLMTPSASAADDKVDDDDEDDETEKKSSEDDDDEGDEDDEEHIGLPWRVAQRRYRRGYLVEHYIRHLCDAQVQLTYAEGDEVWDEGSRRAQTRNAAAQSHMRRSEQQHREQEGEL